MEVGAKRQLHAQEYIRKNGYKLCIRSSLQFFFLGRDKKECFLKKEGLYIHTGIRYKITFFKLSKTRRPNSIATGIDEKSFFNKMIEADPKLELIKNNNNEDDETKMFSNSFTHQLPWQRRFHYFNSQHEYQNFFFFKKKGGRTFP